MVPFANCDQSTIRPTITQSRSRPEKILAKSNSQCR